MNTSSPTYAHTCVTAAALVSICGGDEANTENITQASTIIAPSKSTAQQLLIKLLPTFCDGSPAKVDNGMGAISIPGITYGIGSIIVSEIGDFSRFDNLDKILAYAGCSPTTYQSG